MKNLLKKLSEARKIIRTQSVEKKGKNNFAKYNYFTPEQIFEITSIAEEKVGLLSKFSLYEKNGVLIGKLQIWDVETGKGIPFIMRTAIPDIKGTNVAQQLGGAVTYTHRYLLTTAYKIAENHLDLDNDNQFNQTSQARQPRQQNATNYQNKVTEWLTEEQFEKTLKSEKIEAIKAVLSVYSKNGKGMKKEYKQKLTQKLNELIND